MRFSWCLLASAIVAFVTTPSLAQTKIPANKISDIPSTGACNVDELGSIQGVNRIPVGLGYTFVMKEGANLTVNSSAESGKIDVPLHIFEEATLYGDDPDANKVLIAVRERKICGWAARDMLLMPRPGPIDYATHGDGPPPVQVKDTRFGWNDNRNTLNLKIVLQAAPVFESPGGRKLEGSDRLFAIYEVFQVAPGIDPERGINTRFYLAGSEGPGHKKLRGWVRESDFYPWTTRMTAMWEGSSDVYGYIEPNQFTSGVNPAFVKARGFRDPPCAQPVSVRGRAESPDADARRRESSVVPRRGHGRGM
jgi:hypothetical protein